MSDNETTSSIRGERDLTNAQDMIVCEGVSKWFGDFQALNGVSATIKEQEVVVVLGPSGSGKSTWIRCINRLEQHQEGRIVVDGVELSNDLRNIEKVRSEVGMVFQMFNLFPHLTVRDNISLAPIWVRKTSLKLKNKQRHYWKESAFLNRLTSFLDNYQVGNSSELLLHVLSQWNQK